MQSPKFSSLHVAHRACGGSKTTSRLRMNAGSSCLLHRAVAVHHLVAEHAADVRLHDAAEAIVAAAEIEADVVDRVLEPLEMIARVVRALEQRRELDAADVVVAGRRDRAHLVARTVAELADHDGIQREVRESTACRRRCRAGPRPRSSIS